MHSSSRAPAHARALTPALTLTLTLALAACGDDTCSTSCSDGAGGSGAGSASSGGGGGGGGLACPASGFYHGPWVQKFDETSAVIRWDACAASDVSISVEPDGGGTKTTFTGSQTPGEVTTDYHGVPGVLPDWSGTYYLSEVPVTGLEPATCYRFTVDSEPERGGRFCTSRVSGDTFTLMAIGDTNPAISPIEEMVAAELENSPDFIIHLGDIQYYSSILDSWSQWFVSMGPMLEGGAFEPCVGNHESENPTEYADYYDRLFADAGFDGTREYYRYHSGGIWFFSVDTELDMLTGPQVDWLTAELADAKTQPGFRGSIVYMHRPVISVADGGNHPDWRAFWEPTFVSNGVVLVMSGHMHGYERFLTENSLTYVVSGGGGGLIGDVDANVDTYPEDAALRQASAAKFHTMRLEITSTTLEGTAVGEDGGALDTFSIPLP
ncbi:MAG TPA: metallophosphoesterase [Polyangiaceae bacterium]|nr:metallophosphoesterase [Polyangiaceae bacterium]